MQKKWLKRIVVTTIVAVTALGLVACGKQGEKDKDKDTVVNSDTGNVSYPLDTDVELSIWCGNQMALATDISSWEASPFHSGLETMTGVKMNWLWPTKGADISQAYNLLWMDYEVPNIVFHNITKNDAKTLLEDGLIYDLTDYLPQYAPNYWAWLNQPENENEKKAVQLSDGSFYSVASVKEDVYNMVWIGPLIRQDWLDECNLEAPVTIADWEKVLIAFKDKYGAAMVFNSAEIKNCGGIASGTGALGYLTRADFRVTDDGTVVVPQIADGYKEMMEVMIKWWQMGLIDHDSASASADTVRQKAANGKTGIVFAAGTGALNIIAEGEKNGADWVGLEYPRTAAGAPTTAICHQQNKTTGYHAMISSACSEDELITALRWLDYGWTEDGMKYWNFGTEGVSYEYDENGVVQWTDIIKTDPLGISQGVSKYCGAGGSAPVMQMKALAKANNVGKFDAVVLDWIENTVADKHLLPEFDMEEEDRDLYLEKWSPIATYIEEEAMKMMTGETPFSQYDKFIKKLYDLGLQDVLDIQQKYYDEYER